MYANFIKKYKSCFKKNKTVFCGGLLYQNKKENFKLLRYKYGKKHEEITVEKRKENTIKYFFTSNFLIQKEVFDTVHFEEKLKQYGREDLLFSIELANKGYKINHIKNEVYHLGIEDNEYFVSKTKKAMENLVYIERHQLIEENEIDLLNFVKKIKKLKLMKIAGMYYTFFEKLAVKKSSVFYFNCMKICYVCYLKSMNE